MQTGIRLRRLWGQRRAMLVCAAIALLAAIWSVAEISLLPPGLHSRSLRVASASTHVLVDSPRSVLLDRRQDVTSLKTQTQRAVLLGNVVAREPIRAFIAARADVSSDALQIEPPLTPERPSPPPDADKQRSTGDLLRSNDEYRVSIEVNPTVPLLAIYAQAPEPRAAAEIANGTVDGLRGYLENLAGERATPLTEQIRIVQLGRARGQVINSGAGIQIAILTFLIVFSVCAATAVFVRRMREGWRVAALSEAPIREG
ncbi:MAG: hypothetical protein LC744_04125 [Chloroflexi bacterium]|nr:hypothetical protein [Chloroflexota bacterium]